ncbi:unnamed protein product [Paramecium pentaurelia]|uniref:C2 domain-containing protein n=1 Tax=Paramecium pentaurelia TaxID=43138 RepID=A0A8S1WK29_9CILI|nr:unnamed protein product [Paramecium pentaurelia]
MKNKQQQRQEYLVQVQVIEVRDLKGGDKTGACDPFVKISVGNLPPQVTTTRKAANTAVFNQSFTFTGLLMNSIEFESFEIKIEVYDLKQFGQNQLIGIYSVGISTLYRNPAHEIFNTWLPLVHPKQGLEPQGFLLASAYVISPTDRPPVHDMNENNVEEEPDEFGGVPDDQLNPEQLQARMERKNRIAVVSKPEIRGKSYQLMVNIAKAEDLALMGYPTLDSFISVRAGGTAQITSVMKNQQKPQYLSRLMFPLHFPFFNDKIVVRVWDRRTMATDTFIAMIPEVPTENDYFNINFLQSKGGTMPFRWFNLYGIPQDERPGGFQQAFLGYKKSIIGTDFMGRVLMSINLTQSEKPELMVVPLTTQREPPIDKYLLRFDTYEIQEAKDCGEKIVVKFKVGGQVFKSNEAYIKTEKKSKYKQKAQSENKEIQGITYTWGKQIQTKDEKLDLPADPQQIPDLIVSLHNEKGKRVAYLRIPYSDKDLEINRPKWYTFKSVKQTDNNDIPHSFFLVNIIFRNESTVFKIPKIIVKRDQQVYYHLYAQFYAGYDLCPDLYSEEVEATFVMKIGGQYLELDKPQSGKNPIWNKAFEKIVKIDQNLEFASNIIITFTNKKKTSSWFSNNHIGDICIPALVCKYEGEPIFAFHHIVNQGQSAGRILAAFKLKELGKNKESFQEKPTPIIPQEGFIQKWAQFPVFGVRNLKQKMKDPKLIVQVPVPFNMVDPSVENSTYYNREPCEIIQAQKDLLENDKSWFGGGIQDPVFLKLVNLKVYLPEDIKFYPQLEIQLSDSFNKNERYICSIPLIEVAQTRDQLLIDEARNFFEQGKHFDDIQLNAGKNEDLQEDNDNVVVNNDAASQKQLDQKDTVMPKETQPKETVKQSVAPEKMSQQKQSNQSGKSQKYSTMSKLNVMAERPDLKIKSNLKNKGIQNVEVTEMTHLTLELDDIIEKKKENKEKEKKLLGMIKTYKVKYKKFDQLKLLIKREVEKLKGVEIKETNYFKGTNEVDEDEGYDYGREVLKGPYEEKLAPKIPFRRFALYRLSSTKYGLIGNPTDAVIKGDIRISDNGGTVIDNQKQTKKSKMSKNSKKKSSVKDVPDKPDDYSFNLFDEGFLQFFNQPYRLKVRLYILRCLNLAAQKQDIDAYHKMAGLSAVCSADSYPEIFIGESGHDNQDLIKHITDQDRPIENTLSPNFFRMYELDAELPTDWKMKLHIKSKGMFDSVIGSIQIDIEDRVVGEEKLKQRIAYTVFKERFETEKEALKYDDSQNAERRKGYLSGQITDLQQRIENFDKKFKVPVEYKDLKIDGRQQASQGTVEMFLEVLPIDIARDIEPAPLQAPLPQEYEVRLIIWETFEIPKVATKKVVDIMVTVAMDASATGKDAEVSKETDVHNGSENGDGSFSYRMRFPLVIPCPFPRLKMTVYDFSPFGSNESLGEATMSLKPIIKRLSRDGKYEMPPTKIKLSHPNYPGQNRGQVLIQMKILTKQQADGQPVGDGQDEPNEDPYLVKPTEGRGLADFFKGAGFGMGNFMLYVKIFAGIFITVVVVMILFIKPGILVN